MKNRVYIVVLFCFSISAMFCGCAEDASNGGKSEPMLFSAEICNRTQTRAVVDASKHSDTNLIVRAAEPAKGITLNVSKMTRTSTADGYWPNGASIAVQQCGTTKQYTVDGSGNITSSSPFYWANKNDVSVTSWYPYSTSLPTTWSVNSDQSTESNYNSSDLLYSTSTLSYDGSKTLKFNHETAKVVINIIKANGLMTSSDISSITIGTSITPIILSGTVSSYGSITASTTTGYITPYQTTSSTYTTTYSALVIPQDMNGKQFITIKTANGTTYYYKPSISTILAGGCEYDYNISVPYVNTGDYYFSDGSWGTLADHSNATPIGVIFSNATSSTDQSHGWTHGYALAVKDAVKTVEWGTYDVDTPITNDTDTNCTEDMDGYLHTEKIKDTYAPLSTNNYPAFYYALNYGVTAPRSSSGWFLPSCGQWYQIAVTLGGRSTGMTIWGGQATITLNSINSYLNKVSGSELFYYDGTIKNCSNSWFWSSSEVSANYVYIFEFYEHSDTGYDALINGADKNHPFTQEGDIASSIYGGQVRPAIAF
jgi:hypothetical protein